MSLFDDVTRDMKDAMRARDADRLRALRSIRAAYLAATKRDGSDHLGDEECIGELRRLAKQRRDSIEAYQNAGREDRVAQEAGELAVIEVYLPKLADETQTRAWVQQAIDTTGATSMRDMGRVMGTVMKTHRGQLDGGLARSIVTELLSD
ncbi:MAG: GatB/YqeY domain-containing protein [Myxococcota bacterium]|jgi:hypothetical protein|nr:GatB/YqeY domain-containing protein [Myxococcota bacterium]